jgi:hypothetical protein
VDHGNGVFGDGDDALGASVGGLAASRIGAIQLANAGTPISATGDHQYAIQAAAIQSLKTSTGLFKDFSIPTLLDDVPAGETSDDILLRLL